MIENLKRLAALRQRIKEASMLGKPKLAEEAGEELYQLLVSMAERILKLEQEVTRAK